MAQLVERAVVSVNRWLKCDAVRNWTAKTGASGGYPLVPTFCAPGLRNHLAAVMLYCEQAPHEFHAGARIKARAKKVSEYGDTGAARGEGPTTSA